MPETPGRPTLQTERLVLRPLVPADAPEVRRLAGAAEVADTTLNIPHPYEQGVAEDWIATHAEAFAAGRALTLGVCVRGAGELVGCMGLRIEPRWHRAELGYWIAVEHWGRGYCTEAARAMVDWGFRAGGLHRVYAEHFVRNPASGRVMQKVGMRREGVLREHVCKGDRYEDVCVYGLLRQDWEGGCGAGGS